MPPITDLASITQAVAAVVVAAAGGMWTYLTFLRRRQRYPRAEITQKVVSHSVDAGLSLLSVDVRLENKGEILLSPREAELCIQQVLPLAGIARGAVRGVATAPPRGAEVVGWPILMSRTAHWESGTVELEPGESHTFSTDLLISSEVAMVRITSRIRNFSKHRALWWEATALHDTSTRAAARCVTPLTIGQGGRRG